MPKTFTISTTNAEWPSPEWFPRLELSPLLPRSRLCRQLHYGQGEGQGLIDGCEWGFYFDGDWNLRMVLEAGSLSNDEASRVAADVCAQLGTILRVEFQFREASS